MTDAAQNRIFAHISKTKRPGYTKAKSTIHKKKNYYYMFTGGYTYDASTGTIGPHTTSDDQGPAGEVELTTADSGFSVTVVNDDADLDFRIKQWDLAKDGSLSGEIFSPLPGADLPGSPLPEVLSIAVTEVPTGEKGKYKGYFVTLQDSDGDVVELDPRIYDMRD